jgi:hypothetical protein
MFSYLNKRRREAVASLLIKESWPACGMRNNLRRVNRTVLRLVPTKKVGTRSGQFSALSRLWRAGRTAIVPKGWLRHTSLAPLRRRSSGKGVPSGKTGVRRNHDTLCIHFEELEGRTLLLRQYGEPASAAVCTQCGKSEIDEGKATVCSALF